MYWTVRRLPARERRAGSQGPPRDGGHLDRLPIRSRRPVEHDHVAVAVNAREVLDDVWTVRRLPARERRAGSQGPPRDGGHLDRFQSARGDQ